MIKLFPLALAAAMIAPVAALAQDGESSFTGPYAGVSIAATEAQLRNAPGVGARNDADRGGVAVRGFAGYNLGLTDKVIVGGEVGIASGGHTVAANNAGNRYAIQPRVSLDAVARVGFKPTERRMVFGKAGWAFQRISTDVTTAGALVRDRSSEHGVLFGGGVEYALTDHIGLRGEFDRVSFNDRYKRNRAMAGISYRF